MTETLTQLLRERADAVRFDAVDLDAIMQAGSRAVRRRRFASAGAGLVLAGACVVAIHGSPGSDGDRVADRGALPTETVSWALGSVLHTPGTTFDVGHPIHAYVRTEAGYVVVDGDGTARSLVDGTLREVGRAQGLRVFADTDDSVVAWADADTRGVVMTLDLVTGQFSRYTTTHGDLSVSAIDGTAVYGRDDRGTVRWSAGSLGGAVMDLGQVEAAEDGVVVTNPHDGTMLVIRPGAAPVRIPAQGQRSLLSPDARYLAIEGHRPLVFDATTGEQVRVDPQGLRSTPLEWLGDHTVVLLTQEQKAGPFELVTCSVPDGACRVDVADTGISYDQDEDPEGYAVPVGERLD